MKDPLSPDHPEAGYSPLYSRRQLLASVLTTAALGGLAPLGLQAAGEGGAAARGQAATTPLEFARMLMKMMASQANAMVPWYYTGRIYAVRGATEPVHLFNFEGSEIYWIKTLAEDQWRLSSSTLTFYRDVASGEYLDQFKNPLTGATNQVTPNVLRSRPGQGAVYSADGMSLFGQTYPLDGSPVNMSVVRNGPLLWLQYTQAFAALPQPFLRSCSMMANAAELDDPALSSAGGQFAETTLVPWSKWLDMGSAEGHMLWHAVGRKLGSLEELPAAYRERAEAFSSRHFSDPDNDEPSPRAH